MKTRLYFRNRGALNAVDALIYSMAAAELKVFDEDNRESNRKMEGDF